MDYIKSQSRIFRAKTPKMNDSRFHAPGDAERSFLRIVTFGYPELEAQANSCEVDEFDPDGYCDVRVTSGPPSAIRGFCDGPSLREAPQLPEIDTILWINDAGFLYSVEIVSYGAPITDIYGRFIYAAKLSKLRYKFPGLEGS